jgi:hypothetical protein
MALRSGATKLAAKRDSSKENLIRSRKVFMSNSSAGKVNSEAKRHGKMLKRGRTIIDLVDIDGPSSPKFLRAVV